MKYYVCFVITLRTLFIAAWTAATCIFSSLSRGEELEAEPDKIRNIRIALQEKYANLPELSLNTNLNDIKFHTADLKDSLTEVDGRKHYAFRFRTSAELAPFIWAFKSPKGSVEWFIFPEKGRMKGFDMFFRANLQQDMEGIGAKGDAFFLNDLGKNSIEADKGYIMWFSFDEGTEPKVTLSMNMITDLKFPRFVNAFPMLYPKKETK